MNTTFPTGPILFSDPMVRAILEGRKTKTRRIIKPQPSGGPTRLTLFQEHSGNWLLGAGIYSCPYGKPGDQLWVREAWGLHDTQPSDGPERARVYYRATDGERHDLRYQLWRPSIHMPRWASRITLEIMGIHVERLQNISEADARAEGTTLEPSFPPDQPMGPHRVAFANRWDDINGTTYPWASNPWVWVIAFKRLEARP